MPVPAQYRLVTVPETRVADVLRLDLWAFASGIPLETQLELPLGLPWERSYGVERDVEEPGELAGFHAAYPLRAYPVPGAEVPCGWLTWVGVHPGHRRRGILRAMIEHHFADLAAHGEAISGLMAAETAIYGRFGYGMAAPQLSLSIPRGAALRPVAGSADLEVTVEEWDAAAHGDLCAGIHSGYARVPDGLGRPGWATRETPGLRGWWDADPKDLRAGKENRRVVIVRDAAGTPLAYATFRRELKWTRGGSDGTVSVREAVALTPAAAHRLWSVLLDLDLTSTVRVETLPVDDPIVTLLADLRGAQPDYQDNTWLRIVDLPAALAQRRYATDVDVVLEVTDAIIPSNAATWRVRAAAWDHAVVERTDAAPDLALDIRELSTAHLGSISLASLAQAGLVEVRTPGILPTASAAWRWPIAAGANWIF
ncbi:GNAT family N-acetyltransferase [Humibacter ginsenosidimutans]|uniref:GNAT family N-acetyltransferase n=1 Tax=Humibacter ginsenosidimutans TaxID=2599293 RepID=A0A5B8M404_9MICO|nr:GNAT family N-acetyltransferase [Humibacter ginsenosidimutans]QDZ15518.1 GNAT family N-acetyltransferase [Humibacter ginsenosidimutans]